MMRAMRGYTLYRSSNLRSFLDTHSHLFVSENPLEDPVYIIVQNAGLGEWLLRYLARTRGAVMGPRLLMPEQAMRKFVIGFPAARRLLGGSPDKLIFTDGLKLVLYKTLQQFLAEAHEDFDTIRRYVGTGNEGRTWQLADALAGTFHHYGMNCPALVDAWSRGERAKTAKGLKTAEKWQRRLWNRIFHSSSPYQHLSRVLSTIDESDEAYDGDKGRVLLFGSTFLGERGLGFFRRLGETLDVHHFILAPYTGLSKPQSLFLENNVRLTIGFNALIPKMKPDQIIENWNAVHEFGTTLERLRFSLVKDRDFNGAVEDDDSLAFHDVPGIQRSVEVLKDRILEALRNDSSLAPTQIGVLAPDISIYAPFIDSIFSSLSENGIPRADHLPFNLNDLPNRNESPYPAALDILLDLPGSRFGRDLIVQLAENPCFVPTAGHSDLAEQWKFLIEELNIRWGVDESHRQDEGAADLEIGSWTFGFQRLLAGYYHDAADDPSILPFPGLSDSVADDAGQLMNTIHRLNEQIRPLVSSAMNLKEWTLLWERICTEWLRPRTEDEAERIGIKRVFRDLIALCEDVDNLSDFTDDRITWPVFRGLLEEYRDKSSRRRGRYLARGITCGSLTPTRAIPFRRIYVLGLNEGEWPGHENLAGFDLREQVNRAIDLSRDSVDRSALVEVLFSASDHVSIFYIGRDSERGEVMSPAAPVQELMDHLGAVETIVRRHPLLPFDPKVFGTPEALRTSSPSARMLAEFHQSPPIAEGASPPLSPVLDDEILDWRELARFLKNPVAFFFRDRLEVKLPGTETDRRDSDILEADFLDWWHWRNDAVRGDLSLLKNPENLVEGFRRHIEMKAAVSRTPIGSLQSERWRSDAELLAGQIARIEEEGLGGEPFSCRFRVDAPGGDEDSAFLDLPAPGVSPAGVAPARIIGIADGLRLLQNGKKSDPGIWTMIDFISRQTPSVSHNLVSWTAALTLANAADDQDIREIRIFRVGARDFKARRYYFREDRQPKGRGGEKVLLPDPAALLGKLVRAYRRGQQLPIPLYPDLAEEILKVERKTPGSDFAGIFRRAWNKILNDGHLQYSPLRDCPWRSRFLGNPEEHIQELERIWTDLYRNGGLS